jgi:hypothetical protein
MLCESVYRTQKDLDGHLGELLAASLPHRQHEASRPSTALIQRLLLYQQKLKTTLKI